MRPAERETRLPVTVVAGFLGSGKTTLMNHILTQPHGRRIGVIVNEIGEIGIDGELIVASGDGMLELSNGCICCSMNNDLVDAVFRVLDRPGEIDYLLVETSGVADPLPIVLTFLRSELRDRVRVDAIIAVADAGNFSLDCFTAKAAYNQLHYADTILLNKCDLASAERLDEIEGKLREVKKGARILRATNCRVPLPLILGIDQFEAAAVSIEHADCHHDHLAEDGFQTVSFTSDQPFGTERFQFFLEQLPVDVFRAKGLIRLHESDQRYVFHLVGQRFTLDEGGPAGTEPTKLVLIGRGLDRRRLLDQLEDCLSAPLPLG